MRLNKYLAQRGHSTRREAEQLVKSGKVAVNGAVMTNPGHPVEPTDTVTVDGTPAPERAQKTYVLLNKPKDTVLGPDDPQGRKTIRQMLGDHVPESAQPVRSVDRTTLGLYLLTDDADLRQKLNDPKRAFRQVFQFTLAAAPTTDALTQISAVRSPTLHVSFARFTDGKLDVELQRGSLKALRKVLDEHGIAPTKTDRTYLAGLTKRDLPRGRFRFLDEREVRLLRHFS